MQLRRKPILPVAQKGQPIAQPTWVLTHTVARRALPPQEGLSMATVSTVCESSRAQSSLTVVP